MRLIDAGMRDTKYIRADLFWNKIAESAFFSAAEKGKIRAAIENEPGEDVKPVVHAHWVPQHPNNRTGKAYIFVCSNCKKFAIKSMPSSIDEMGYVFCPYCGAEINQK